MTACPLVLCFLGTAAAAFVGVPNVETLLVVAPSDEHPRHSEGDVVALKDGRLCAVYTRFVRGSRDDAAADLAARMSADGGKSWTGDRVLVANEGKANVMSASLVRLKDGTLLLFYLRKNGWDDCRLYVRRSTDELRTLGEPVPVTDHHGYHVVNNGRVVRLLTGRLVVPCAVHPCPDGTPKTFSPKGIPRAYLSDDDGRSWRADAMPASPPPDRRATLQEPGVVELRDSRLWMWMRTMQGTQCESFSTDGGVHWSEPAPGRLASPCSPATIARVPWTGDLLCVWNDHSGRHAFTPGRRTPLCVAVSRDEGRTWGPSRVIEGNPDGWYCYTSITFAGDRVILSYSGSEAGKTDRIWWKVIALSRAWLSMD